MRLVRPGKSRGPGRAGCRLLGASRTALLLWGSRGAPGSGVTAGEQGAGTGSCLDASGGSGREQQDILEDTGVDQEVVGCTGRRQ